MGSALANRIFQLLEMLKFSFFTPSELFGSFSALLILDRLRGYA